MGGVRLTLRVDFGTDRAIGPGKVLLLEAIRDTGNSISQAGRSLGMSYRRAWLLVDDMNRCFREPVVTAQPGGAQGGGAALTAFGETVVQNNTGRSRTSKRRGRRQTAAARSGNVAARDQTRRDQIPERHRSAPAPHGSDLTICRSRWTPEVRRQGQRRWARGGTEGLQCCHCGEQRASHLML